MENSHLEQFLSDNDTVAALSTALKPFGGPSQKSAGEFDTKTAPINISQSDDSDYNIGELKADATWLSGEMKLDEVTALRMAIIEWQERAADQLLYTAPNGAAGDAMAVDLASSAAFRSSLNAAAPTTGGLARPALDFASEDVRRQRLLTVYASEKNHLLRLDADLVTRMAVSKPYIQTEHPGALREHVQRTWIDKLAQEVFERTCKADQASEHEAFCVACIRRVEALLDGTENQVSWPKAFVEDQAKAQVYLDSQYSEVVSILRILLANLYAFDGIPGPAAVVAWYSAMDKYDFLQDGKPFFAGVEVVQLLVSIISAEILKLQLVVGEIMTAAGVETLSMTGSLYIKDDSCVKELTTIFHNIALRQLKIVAPALYAWSIITSLVRDIALVHQEVRERRIEQLDSDTDETARYARRGSRDLRSDFEVMYFDAVRVPDLESQTIDTPASFAMVAVDRMDVFGLIVEMSACANNVYNAAAEAATGFVIKETLLDVMREGMPFVKYDAPVLDAILSVLTPAKFSPVSQKQSGVLAGKLLYDFDQLRPAVIDQALARYPYELVPLLRLFTALASAESRLWGAKSLPETLQLLDHLESYTQAVDDTRRNGELYALSEEETDQNKMVLLHDVPIFVKRQELLSWDALNARQALPPLNPPQDEEGQRVRKIGAGTAGVIVKETRPFVFKFAHPHSGLEYLGLQLSTFVTSSEEVPAAPGAALDRLTAADTVALFTALLTSALRSGTEEATVLLGRLSYALQHTEQDIVSVVADILESELLAHLDQSSQDGSLELVTACVEFINTLVRISPERVWSLLARSSLLGVKDGACSLESIIGGIEVQTGQYRFLRACVELHTLLLDDAIAGLVKRKAKSPRTTNRFAPTDDQRDNTPERTMSVVLNAYQKILLDVFQNMFDWKFEVPVERCTIVVGILDSFTRLFRSTYGIDFGKDPSKRLTIVLAPAAQALLSLCAPMMGNSPIIAAFARMFQEALPLAEDSLPMQIRRLLIQQSKAAFTFLTMLVRVSKSGANLLPSNDARSESAIRQQASGRASSLATRLLQSMPVFASLLASDHALKAELFTLLRELVQAAAIGDEEPPSLLAQLDAVAQKAFLKTVTQLDGPLCDVQVERRVWDFLSAVMSNKQQWFAVYLLTGELPKKRTHRHNGDRRRRKSLLVFALDQLSTISMLPPERALGMLHFVATAQQTWIWATNQLRSHADFLKNTLAWLDTLGPISRDPSPGASIICAKEYEMASYLCDIYAISLHASLEIGDKTILKALTPKLTFLRNHGVTVNAYNKSLHRNLAENLKRKFPVGDLSDFRRTEVNPAGVGSDYFYDRDFAASILRHDQSWLGTDRGRGQGFADEFSRANANLGILHAQMRLLRSWKTLATTLCEGAEQDSALHAELAEVAHSCLMANASPRLDEPDVAEILDLRIELAFLLIAKLVALKVEASAMMGLLPAAWELVRTSPVDYDVATASEDMRYYREMLQVLYLTIQPHGYVRKADQSKANGDVPMEFLAPAVASCLVDIVGKVVAPGFRALCGNLHTDADLALPADFALLTAILKALLAVPGISSVYTLLSDLVAGSSVVRGALSLYSWADQLAKTTDQDPVYGEIAVMFLLALSTVRPIAEQMALEGALTQLASSNASNYFRKPGGKGPFDEPRRMFVIWTEGFLPLCLNLLDSVGPPIAAEVAAFLSSFPEQLRRAERSLQNEAPSPKNPRAGAVTLSLVSEAHSLTMIAMILSSDAARGAAEGITDVPTLSYDVESVKALVEALSRGKRSLSDRITPLSPLEERWARTPVSGASDNLLMEKVFKEVFSMVASFGNGDAV